MNSRKFVAGDQFPAITLPKVGGGTLSLGQCFAANPYQLLEFPSALLVWALHHGAKQDDNGTQVAFAAQETH